MQENKEYTFYKLIFPNEYTYVGITTKKLTVRWGKNGSRYSRQYVWKAIQHFGWDNIKKEYIEGLSKEEARQKEQDEIKYYKSIGKSYNITNGGELGGKTIFEVEYHGKKYTFNELAEISPAHVTASEICSRINQEGWDVERAITQPDNVKLQPFGVTGYKYNYNGKNYSMYELWQMRKIDSLTQAMIQNRINKHGWDIDRALSTPAKGCNVEYDYKGGKYTTTELAKLFGADGVTKHTITDRLASGWNLEDAITTPISDAGRIKLYHYNGKDYTLKELIKFAKYDSLSINALRDRIKKGWDIQDALDMPPGTKRKKNNLLKIIC